MSPLLLILGASIRAAAASAQRAGFSVSGGDLFADVDLCAHCDVRRASRYPADLIDIARHFPSDVPWLYTGALENYPDLVDHISRERPLYGNRADTLRQVRDPRQLASVCAAIDVPTPPLAETAKHLPRDGTWLAKRLRGSGGGHVRVVNESWPGPLDHQDVYYQQSISGTACAAVYIGNGRDASLLGVTRQILGAAWCGARGYQYAGSIGPLTVGEAIDQRLRRLGSKLAAAFGLAGLFGVDFVLQADRVWPIEVNPRYTASVEVLERASDLKSIQVHVAACRDGRLPIQVPLYRGRVCAKAILFATHAVEVTARLEAEFLSAAEHPWPGVADIPQPGTGIAVGRPVMTVFAQGGNHEQALGRLQQQMALWQQKVHASPG